MSPLCAILRGSFDDYLADALPAPQRRILREHLAACADCGKRAAAQDPTFLFARPLRAEVGAAESAQILSAVRTGVALLETERRIQRGSSRRYAGGIAAAAALAALLLTVPGERRQAELTASRPVPSPAAPVQPAALAAEPGAELSSATVYDLNPGASREEPRVVWIVDRGLDI
jgi:hypothetical protein